MSLIVDANLCCIFRLQMYDFVEHKVQGDGNCQVSVSLFLSILAILVRF
jgi:hypothetical protein